ncbi:hypothetical protein [Cellulomonas sp. URHB0016]
MLDATTVPAIEAACEQFDVTVPKAVIAAKATQAEADRLVAEINSEAEPSLETLTAKTVRSTHTAMVARLTNADRARAAEAIKVRADYLVLEAWTTAGADLLQAFRKPFDTAATDYRAALDVLAYNTDFEWSNVTHLDDDRRALTDAASRLEKLAALRHALAATVPPVDTGLGGGNGMPTLNRHGRYLTFPDLNTAMNVLNARTAGTKLYSAEWWARVARTPGIVITWRTPNEQQTLSSFARSGVNA